MSLPNHGVLIGTFNRFEREPADNYGNWYHGFVFVDASGQTYRCAVDVFKPDGGFQYMMLGLQKELFTTVSSLTDGYHELSRDAASGAIDYIRSPLVKNAEGCLAVFYALLNAVFGGARKVWVENNGDNALDSLQALVSDAARVYVFGAPFHNTNPVEDGMHDVHMNQGDPPGQFYAANGIWQDGCVIAEKPDGSLRGYFGKFVDQSLHTDDNGNPL